MATSAGHLPIVQVHPTRRCNLSCAHCYTSSGPDVRGEIPLELLAAAVTDAALLGYRQLSVSGGEPFLYPSLGPLLRAARQAGMATSVTTNGMLLTPNRLGEVAPHLDFLAVSVDGPPADHNRLRQSNAAFPQMYRHLADIRAAGVPFGFIFTLTRYNADQLEWLVGLAEAEGAAAVQIHPLTRVGRARSRLRGAEPDDLELLAAMTEIARLRGTHPGIALHLDAATKGQVVANRNSFVPDPGSPLFELVPTLIVDDAGLVTPLTHDLEPSYTMGSIFEAPLCQLAQSWQRQHADRLVDLLARAHDMVCRDPALATYWHDAVASASRAHAFTAVARSG